MTDQQPTILFDDGCRLCRGAVSFLRRRGGRGRFRFLPLGSPQAAELLATVESGCDTLHLFDASGHHDRSTAVLRAAVELDRPWSALRFLRVIPRGLRDAVYNLIAQNRVSWFGRADQTACRRD